MKKLLAAGIAALSLAQPALADCKQCGTVTEVKAIKEDAANDKTTATAVQAGAKYQVIVKMDTGKPRNFSFKQAPDFKAGDKVKIVNGAQLAKQ